jgi:hypothetical protein
MNVNLLPFAVCSGILVLVSLFLFVYRKLVSSREDDSVDLQGYASIEQMASILAVTHKRQRAAWLTRPRHDDV